MYAYYPYQFEYQPQLHLRTDYPPHQSYPYSQYQDLNDQQETQMQIQGQQQEQGQYSSQIGQHQQQQFYQAQQPVSTPGTSIDTPTSGFSTCSTSASTGSSSMPYYTPTPPTQPHEMIFTDPLVRPQQSPTIPDHNLSGPDVIGMEGHYSYEYDEYEWTGEQQQQQQQQILPISSAYPSPSPSQQHQLISQNSSRSSPQPQVPFELSSFESPSQQHAHTHTHPRSQSQSHIPPPRLTRPIRREREQPFRAFHPYANNNPTRPPSLPTPAGSGEKEKGIETGGIIVEGDVNLSSSVLSSRPALIMASSSTMTSPLAAPPASAQKAESQPQSQSQSQPLSQPQSQSQPQPQHQPQSSSQHQTKIQSQPELQPQPHSETRQRPQKPVPTIVTAPSNNPKPSTSKIPSQKNNSTSATSSSTSNLSPAASVAPFSSRPSSHNTTTITRTTSPTPIPTPPTIIGLFGSYPLSRTQALPGPTCAPETSSSVMRLVLTPGALAHGGNGSKKDKSEKGSSMSNGGIVDQGGLSVRVNMTTMTPTTFNSSPNNNNSSSFPVEASSLCSGSGDASSTTNNGNTNGTTHNTFNNTPTLGGINAAQNSSQSTMTIRKPRMACYFCRKRKIACGPGPVAIELAKRVQQAQIQIQQQHQFQEQSSEGMATTTITTMDDSSSKIKFSLEGDGSGSVSSPTSPLTPSSPPSISTSPTMSTLTPAQLLSHPQALTGDEGPCNQCARRGLSCDRPTESKRGVRKGKSKKEKEKEARERETTKELSPSKKVTPATTTTAGEKEKKEKERSSPGKIDDDKVGDDEEGDVNEEVVMMNEDLDMYMDGDDDETGGYEKRISGGNYTLKVENEDALPTSSLGTTTASAPNDAQPQLPSSTTVSEQNPKSATTVSHKTQKHPNRGRGRPPKHPKLPPVTPTSSIRHQSSSTSGVKSNLKWTTPAAAGKKNKAGGKFKGKNGKDLDVVVPAVGVSHDKDRARAVAESVDRKAQGTLMNDEVEREMQVGVILNEGEDADDGDDGMDEDFDDDNDEDGGDDKCENETNVRELHPSDPVQTTEAQHGFSSHPAMYVSQSPNVSPSVSSVPPYTTHTDPHSYTPASTSASPYSEIVAQQPDSHSYYSQPHPHSPTVVEPSHQEQPQLGFSADEMDAPSPVANTVYNGATYQDNHNDADNIHNPHDATIYSLGYVMLAPTQHPQEQQQSMPPLPQPEHVPGVTTYPSFGVHRGTDLYNMNGQFGTTTEIGSYDMTTTSWGGYDVQMNDGYMVETASGMSYVVDGQTETQAHEYSVIGTGYDSYDYGYAYTGQYAV
ncbi:hypothetical protein Clacol_000417 [Clathrus columnatus]|uniref:Zn(2)-C6 fungal-type domain-containing protein n=1 Tax=Clathrus columnatus TaxID=1419009 RepID=A0AAV4ZWN0_9AGAM|nr:hypothetical protein Clacol_000417 [Clathrus columnatus]